MYFLFIWYTTIRKHCVYVNGVDHENQQSQYLGMSYRYGQIHCVNTTVPMARNGQTIGYTYRLSVRQRLTLPR